ncbi:MAG: alanine dehydrogenase [Alphaproteobacteria bacterium]
MRIGIPKEVKNHEYRVGLTPGSVRELVSTGQEVFVETTAGIGSGFHDQEYQAVGAQIVADAATVYETADMIVKVKEPQPHELNLLRKNQILFAYLHLAPDPEQAKVLIAAQAIAIAYETVTDAVGGLPLLAPMSAVAGRIAIQTGAACLEKKRGGSGVLLGGVPGVPPGKVLIIGGGVAGYNAARMAVGLGASVTIIDKNMQRLNELDQLFESRVQTIFPTLETIEAQLRETDLVIGAVLIAGGAAPKIVTRAMIQKMRKGSVLVDLSIDQGGCFETSRPTTHEAPYYITDGIIHYCVTNMPGAVARTSTFALNNATLPFVKAIATKGVQVALQDDPHLRNGLNICLGQVTHATVARALGFTFTAPEEATIPYRTV